MTDIASGTQKFAGTSSARLKPPVDSQPVGGLIEEDKSTQPARRPTRGQRRQRIVPAGLRKGSLLQLLAALIWLPQAGLLAYAVGQLAEHGFVSGLAWIIAAVFTLGVLRCLLQALGERFAFLSARQALSQLRETTVHNLTKTSPLDRNRAASGHAASVLAEQAETVISYWSRYQPVQMRVMLVPLAILLVVVCYSWIAALVLLIAAPLIPIFMALIGYRAKAASEEQLVEMSQMNSFLLDRLRGLATIRTFHAVDLTAQRLRNNAETLRRKTMIVLRIAFLSSAVLELFSALGVAMLAVYIGFHLLGQIGFGAWGGTLTLSQGLFILLLAPAFFEPLRELSAVWHDKAAGEAAIDALDSLKGAGNQLVSPVAENVHIPSALDGAVVLNAIDFGYDPQSAQKILQAFSLSIRSGEHVALLGPSGSGKSTILALMAGLIAPQQGSVLLHGTRLDAQSAAFLRKKLAWIGQKPHIFSGTIRSNVSLGRGDFTLMQIEQALQVAALEGVASAALTAPLGENGSGISGGEGLRLALARAALKSEADIIFADEPTAHLDSDTAQQVMQGLLRLGKGRTMIIATHDEELAKHMHRVIRFDLPLDTGYINITDTKLSNHQAGGGTV